jgi:hypothetical protein
VPANGQPQPISYALGLVTTKPSCEHPREEEETKHTCLPLRRELEVPQVLAVDVAFRPSQGQVRRQAAIRALNVTGLITWAAVSPSEWN